MSESEASGESVLLALADAVDQIRIQPWQRNALCHPEHKPWWLPSESFFITGKRDIKIDGVRRSGPKLVEAALAVCSMCPSQYDCFRWAVRNRESDGVWGAPFELVEAWQKRTYRELDEMIASARELNEIIQDAAQENTSCSSSKAPAARPSTGRTIALSVSA